MNKIYTGRNIGRFDWSVTLPWNSEYPLQVTRCNKYSQEFNPDENDWLSFHLARLLDSLEATKIKKGIYFLEDKNIVIDFNTDEINVGLILYGGLEEQVKKLETSLKNEIELHRIRNNERITKKNKELRKRKLNRYYQTNEEGNH